MNKKDVGIWIGIIGGTVGIFLVYGFLVDLMR
jgi:hypothetical protein